MTNTKTNRGFTLVELLIVIVVIAILAAISIVAYNGIQQRARNSSTAESASQLKNKVEAWNGVKGAYPTTANITAGLVDAEVTEAALGADLTDKIGTTAPSTTGDPIQVTACGTPQTGLTITYLVEGGTNEVINLGTGC